MLTIRKLEKLKKAPWKIPKKYKGWELHKVNSGFFGGTITYEIINEKIHKKLLRKEGLEIPKLPWPPIIYVREQWGFNSSRYWLQRLQLMALEYINMGVKEMLLDSSPFHISVHTQYNNVKELIDSPGINALDKQRRANIIIIDLKGQLFFSISTPDMEKERYLVDSSFSEYTLTPKKEILGKKNLCDWVNSYRGALN